MEIKMKGEHKNYKESESKIYMLEIKKRGQVTIFVVVAIAIIIAIILVIFLFPNVTEVFVGEFNPNSFLRDCVEKDVVSGAELLASQGGYANPEGFIVQNGKRIKYLCYNSGYYKTCQVQQPLLKQHFESELEAILTPVANECARKLSSEFENRGFDVSRAEVSSSFNIVPGKINVEFIAPMTITKDTTETFRNFEISIDSELYDLLLTASSIVEFESEFGDSETTLYMQYYPDLKIEKMKLDDGSTIYVLSDVVTGESFTFASRSLAWPPGYGLE